ncbi:hypothetical protein JOD63_003461 [Microbacterium terrae]|uniref:Gylcosyl hydrolase 115 C-terminal domain-containing protein n=1 Tax=Microbacterium terrae TaxID=69369 RepID=A0A0M2HJJ4_9MICO|nr:glycosyl hydrolase 115 family protein [Microbacterium terrae]KJL44504.1 hypothetical protein RS81_00498 [Microbacterium terrae]MBP1079493.1 hypothetical protein [Microbacterium terrae]GLJ96834.1 hypothetical protein GCM10017594_00310 [Microbacterium terrae]
MTLPPNHDRLSLRDRHDGVLIAERATRLQLALDPAEPAAVQRAARRLADDLRSLVGAEVDLDSASAPTRIVVGTLGVSEAVDTAVAEGRLDVRDLYDETGAARWEGFTIAVVDDVLHLVGTDRRGTVYAVYEFARAIGVSPWQWWADAPVHPRDHITLPRDTRISDWPSVRYRGVFINDEEELFHWSRLHTADDTIGPETYERLFELLLRLGGNYIWPAMHVGAFNHDAENGRLAHEMGIVVGSSHCDMLLRSNNHEFTPWSQARPEPVIYDYSLEGSNRDALREYWRGSVEQNGDYEVTWTVGIRGVHDSGFETAAIDADESLDDDGKFRARVELLEKAIEDQRSILSDTLGVDPTRPPQLFIPYKEVLPLYDAGLQVPDDVTLVWANDNFGYIRRFPSDAERERAGGHGLYYHSSYWSNYTTSYLATSSTPLALMRSELTKAWDGGIRQLWVDNVGGLKPLEIETEFFLRCAWEAGRETTTGNVRAFIERWTNATFSGSLGARAADIYARYYQLNNQRKYEHLSADVFSQTGYGDEAGRRLASLRELFDETNALMAELPEDERDAFFQMFAIKIHMSYLVNGEFVYADRSTLAYEQGRHAAADAHVATARSFGDLRRRLIHFYNTTMSDGRWDGMFTPEAFPPPVMPLFAPGTPALRIAGHGLGVTAWSTGYADARHLTFAPYGRTEKWIEVSSLGHPGTAFAVDCDDWIEVSPAAGIVQTEQRLAVRVRSDMRALAGRRGRIRVVSPDTGQTTVIEVQVADAPSIAPGHPGWIEADGVVSIDPSMPDSVRPSSDHAWSVVEDLGRYANGALMAQRINGSRAHGTSTATATFGFHLATPGTHVLELHRLPSLDSTGRIRVGVSIDGDEPRVVESETTDEHRGHWASGIQDNVERLRVHLPRLAPGAHTLTLHAIDPAFAVSKAVIYTSRIASTNLGPEFSTHTDRPSSFVSDPDPAALDMQALRDSLAALFRGGDDELPTPDQLYADRSFWSGDTTNRRPIAAPQPRRSLQPESLEPPVAKDLLAGIATGPLVESGGVVAFEAEDALADTGHAWLTPEEGGAARWVHTQAESAARVGLALQVRPRALRWHDPLQAPAMHFAIDVTTGGSYRVWLLVSFQDDRDDSCVIALDGVPQPVEDQFSHGSLCTYGLRQAWVWTHISDLEIAEGRHTFSIHARESGLRVDRIYLTLGNELPPIDARWQPTARSVAPPHHPAIATAVDA